MTVKTVAIVGTFDTKARELQYIKALIEEKGMQALCINTGVFEPQFQPISLIGR